jgi:hypothetical protein
MEGSGRELGRRRRFVIVEGVKLRYFQFLWCLIKSQLICYLTNKEAEIYGTKPKEA